MHVDIDAINSTFYIEAQEPNKAIFEIASSNNSDMNIDIGPEENHVNIDVNSNDNDVNVDVIDKDIVISFGGISSESNDLSSSVTWVNVPDANITESSVTQHQSALTITESQISDLSSNPGTQLTEEQVQDFVGDMVTGNTETGITVTYDDSNGKLDFVVASQTDENFTTADHSKLDSIEAGADVTDTTNVSAAGALMDSEVTNLSQVKAFDSSDYATTAQGAKADTAQQPPSEGAFTNGDKTKLDSIEAGADVTDATNVDSAGAVMNTDSSIAGMSFVVDEDDMTSDSDTKVPTQQSVKAYVDANAGGATLTEEQVQDFVGGMVTGNTETGITVTYQDVDGTLDFVVASQTDENFTTADRSKLDGIEANADVTDTDNVTAAGALMDSEVTNLAQIKAFDSSDYATAAQGTKADTAQQPPSEGAFANGDKTKLDGIETGATANDTDSNLKNRSNHTGTQVASTISDFDTAVTDNAAVAANTAKVSNVTHTGDVTGSDALTISNNAITPDKIGAGGFVFNEAGDDVDFRIEGDTDQNLFFVDASTDRIGIGTDTPATTLDIGGTITATGFSTSTGTSSQFLTADGGVTSYPQRYNIRADGSTNTFTTAVTYDVGRIDIFQNGIQLYDGEDFSATNGTSFTLNGSIPSGSLIEYIINLSQAFNPSSISGLQMWIDTDHSNSITNTSFGISQVDDRSPNGNNLVQTNTSYRPQLSTNALNGRNVINFNGTDERMTCDAIAADVFNGDQIPYSTIVVWRSTGSSTKDTIYAAANDSTTSRVHYRVSTSSNPQYDAFRLDDSGDIKRLTDLYTHNTFIVSSITFGGSIFRHYTNGTNDDFTTGSEDDTTVDNFTVGAAKVAGSFVEFLEGDIAELLIYDHELSDSDRTDIENYLMYKWGIS